ncbi:MAG: alanine--tRNA ligase [Syntrophobacterales bacterium]|nr:MAG: alanine--tRNA ligase [Syntrophobacterales bacterium]
MDSNEIRKTFLSYFENRGHQIVPSSPLVSKEDPSLLFTNAGMVQFKRVFLREEKRDYTRAVSSQKCVRAGGKHNDLENVGKTARHHTFFEMLGNFSFGDYFKEGAIEFGWDLLNDHMGLPKEKLWISIYEEDEEAFGLWHRKVGIPSERIVRLGEKENFWAMGETGPCGPCSEIIIDQGEGVGCGSPDCGVACECDRFLELWNLVFMQFNREENGQMTPLPKPCIDTGMGLERIAAVLQGVTSNYDTDLFCDIIARIEEVSSRKYGKDEGDDISIRVIADHARAAAFLIGDGVLPDKAGRGYVLRRIMRRAVRHGRKLGITGPFLGEVSGVVTELMRKAYPELVEHRNYIRRVIELEETGFSETLDRGLNLLREETARLAQMKSKVIPGSVVFMLYDTYGFPVDLTEDIVQEEGFRIDLDGFEGAMEEQRRKARESWKGIGEEGLKEIYGRISSEGIETQFLGYDEIQCTSKVVKIIQGDHFVDKAETGDLVEIVVERTPFYGETGGQVGDKGKMVKESLVIEINDVRRPMSSLILHRGLVKEGILRVGDEVVLSIDEETRARIALNHTATHLLHSALREILGDHVKQAGSLVEPRRLRFDFTHFSPLAEGELVRVEDFVNGRIRQNIGVDVQEMETREAIQEGATALFGEKYGDKARVVSISDFSKELCGGTHTSRTGDVGLFKIIAETGVAAGVRRIEALTGEDAVHYVRQQEEELKRVTSIVKAPSGEVASKVKKLLDHQRKLEREIESLRDRLAGGKSIDLMDQVRVINGVKVLAAQVEAGNPQSLRTFGDTLKDRIGSGIVLLGSKRGKKVSLLMRVTDDLLSRFNADTLIKPVAEKVGGNGGGRPDMAQAGGTDVAKLEHALHSIYKIVEEVGKA